MSAKQIDLNLFPSIANSYECATDNANSAELQAYAATAIAEIQTILAKSRRITGFETTQLQEAA